MDSDFWAKIASQILSPPMFFFVSHPHPLKVALSEGQTISVPARPRMVDVRKPKRTYAFSAIIIRQRRKVCVLFFSMRLLLLT